MMGGLGLRVKNSLEQAKPLPADRPTIADFASLRYPRDPRPAPLNDLTIDWILYLPAEVRPQLLGKRYPRIANILAAAWLRPEKFKARLHEFMHDKRGTRQGFPVDIADELKKLESYFNTLCEYSAWDSKPEPSGTRTAKLD